MKVLRLMIVVAALGSLLVLSNCGSPPTPVEPVADQQFTKLAKSWKATGVKLDGVDKLADYPNFVLTISGTKATPPFDYSVAGRPQLSAWKSSGKWTFDTDPIAQIIRDAGTSDEVKMSYSVNATTLEIQFTYNGAGYTRVEQVKGIWSFTFTAQ